MFKYAYENNKSSLQAAVVAMLTVCGTATAKETVPTFVLDADGTQPAPRVVIEGVCAWPNLTRLPNGDIVALIHNQPSHGQLPGDVECWASTDEGETWTKRSIAAPRETPEQNRMNIAAGLTKEGNLILVTSGWSSPGDPTAEGRPYYGHMLSTWVCISKDNGKTWSIDKKGFPSPDAARGKASWGAAFVPFGNIMPGEDNTLRIAAYSGRQNYVISGDGESWDAPIPLSDTLGFNETDLLYLGDSKWLAAARYQSGGLTLYSSDDDAKTWKQRSTPTGNLMHPAHLLRLADGVLVLSYGNRNDPMGVEVKFSTDTGRTWSQPFRVLNTNQGDIGYPSSVLRKDGRILTAYYANGIPAYSGYHMGVVIWDPNTTRKQ